VRDGPIRRAVKRVALWSFVVDVAVDRAVRRLRGERPYRLGGECRRCARCCEAPAIRVSRAVWYLPALRRAFLWWQEHVNGFALAGRDVAGRAFVFRCSHFDWETRSCDSYDSRPGMCRDYPRLLMYQPHPELHAGCGYRPVAPNAAALRLELDRRGLSPAQKEKLRRELFLDG
jgi:Fe-S-cluster containining protein